MATEYDGQGKGHDPLCPYGPHRAPTVAPCRTCLVINKVRANEREQAAQRVRDLGLVALADRIVAAARGEAT